MHSLGNVDEANVCDRSRVVDGRARRREPRGSEMPGCSRGVALDKSQHARLAEEE
jgi:hypothetical protein